MSLTGIEGNSSGKVLVASVILRVTGHGRITFVTRRLAFQSDSSLRFCDTQVQGGAIGKDLSNAKRPKLFRRLFSASLLTENHWGIKRPLWGKHDPLDSNLPLVAKPWI